MCIRIDPYGESGLLVMALGLSQLEAEANVRLMRKLKPTLEASLCRECNGRGSLLSSSYQPCETCKGWGSYCYVYVSWMCWR